MYPAVNLRMKAQSKKTVVLDILFIFMEVAAFTSLAYLTTLRSKNAEIANLSLFGITIGLIGLAFQLMFWLGGILPCRLVLPPEESIKRLPFNIMTISLAAIFSFVLQFAMTFFGHSSIHDLYQWNPTYANIFYCSMAIMETLFFQLFIYRLIRFLLVDAMGRKSVIFGHDTKGPRQTYGVLIAIIGVALAFGFGYHWVVYNGNLTWMSCAFIGCVFYNLLLEVTDFAVAPSALHILNNWRPG